jgi:hypothetical protein
MERQGAAERDLSRPAVPTVRMSEPTLLSPQRTAGNRAIAFGGLAREAPASPSRA